MCLVGKLAKVSIILGDGCPQPVVSCVLRSGDVILVITINNWSVSRMLFSLWYFFPIPLWNKVVSGTLVIALRNFKTWMLFKFVFHVGNPPSYVNQEKCVLMAWDITCTSIEIAKELLWVFGKIYLELNSFFW